MSLGQKIKIKIGQVYKSNRSDLVVEIKGRKGDKFRAVVLTKKAGVYAGSHTFSRKSLYSEFNLIS